MFENEQLENQRIFLAEGKPVAMVGVVVREGEIFSCPVKVALIGGVATSPDFRRQGLSSRLLADAWQKLRADGVDFALVSGSRPLYWRAGCAPCRPSYVFGIAPGAKAGTRLIKEDFRDDLETINQIYQTEAVRFHRSPELLQDILQGRPVGHRPAMLKEKMVFALIEGRAYVVGWRIEEQDLAPYIIVVEYAGERGLLAETAPTLAARWGRPVHFEVPFWEETFRALLTSVGVEEEFRPAGGTVKILNLPQLMEKLRPLWEKGLEGRQKAIRLVQAGEEAGFIMGEASLTLQGGAVAELVFGTTEARSWAADQVGLREALESIFPLPGLRYGLDFV